MDYSAVIVVVKAESPADIPHHLNFKNHDSSGSVGRVHIFHIEDIDIPSDDSGPDSDRESDGPPSPQLNSFSAGSPSNPPPQALDSPLALSSQLHLLLFARRLC